MCYKYGDDKDDDTKDDDTEDYDVAMHSNDSIDDDNNDGNDDVDDGNNSYADSYGIIPSVVTHQFLRTPLPEVVNINTVEGAALRI